MRAVTLSGTKNRKNAKSKRRRLRKNKAEKRKEVGMARKGRRIKSRWGRKRGGS